MPWMWAAPSPKGPIIGSENVYICKGRLEHRGVLIVGRKNGMGQQQNGFEGKEALTLLFFSPNR